MVATKLSQVTAKGLDWAYGTTPERETSSEKTTTTTTTTNNTNDSYWSSATTSLQSAVDQGQATLAGLISSVFYENGSESSSLVAPQQDTLPRINHHNTTTTTTPSDLQQPSKPRLFLARSSFSIQPESFTWMWKNNPYSSVRGRHDGPPQSVEAVRSLLGTLPTTSADPSPTLSDEAPLVKSASDASVVVEVQPPHSWEPPESAARASQLAEGTLRALRDLHLHEAVELHESLRYWTVRWERPLLSWWEAGPLVWCSRSGYRHAEVGQRVSQIQAVLARRCAAIGELQQHLWRAGWQKGVAQWGVLGQGGQWATVIGGTLTSKEPDKEENVASPQQQPNTNRWHERQRRRLSTYSLDHIEAPPPLVRMETEASLPLQPHTKNGFTTSYDHYSILVNKTDGGGIETDNPALAAWSVDAMRLIRDSLFRAGNGKIPIPCEEHWPEERSNSHQEEEGVLILAEETQEGNHSSYSTTDLPLWAQVVVDDVVVVQNSEPVMGHETNQVGANNDDIFRRLGVVPEDDAASRGSKEERIEAPVSMDASDEKISSANLSTSQSPPRQRQADEAEAALTVDLDGDGNGEGAMRASASLATGVASGPPPGERQLDASGWMEEIDNKPVPKEELPREGGRIIISDVPLMTKEVSELLDSMEVIMQVQRSRRLEKLKAPSRFRRNWYRLAITVPTSVYVIYRLVKDRQGIELAKFATEKVATFFNEHIADPVSAIFGELFMRKSRDTMSDRKARLDAIETLKKMIRSWLDETYPEMKETERSQRAESMDMSLIEQRKEDQMKTIYEINSVIRMSFIEMQFIKKEMMNALYALDEMVTSNEINLNLAAVTPAVLLVYSARYVFKFLYYALLRLGKSREETYASFRHVILDIERLLVMRDHPPSPPMSPSLEYKSPSVLNSDDLGMLMLHIHECRTILWKDRRRFSTQLLRDVAEDLAELSGERGIVSVQQQLKIISRMCRTYPFLKVVSTGVSVDLSRIYRL